MRTFLRAAILAATLSLLLGGGALAKGEAFSATVGPIDGVSAGTPTQVSVQITIDGRRIDTAVPAYLDFSAPKGGVVLDFPLVYDRSAGAYVAEVTLPQEGNWLVAALLRGDVASIEPFGRIDGTRMVSVSPAATAAPPAATPATPAATSPLEPLLAGAAGASAAWMLGIGAFVIRRRRGAAAAQPPSISEQLTA